MKFAPCFIGLWSIYNRALILLSWAFIRMHLEGLNPLSQTWVYNIFITLGPKSSLSKGFFPLGPMIAIKLWSYEPFKLRYTFGFSNKPLTCENFFSFIPKHLRVYHNFRIISSILHLFFVL